MKAKWLLEKKVLEDNRFEKELKYQNFEYKVVSEFNLEDFDKDDCVIFFGSLGMAQDVRRKAPWIPGVYCDLPKFECTYYYPRFGKYLLNENYVMLPFGDLMRRKQFLLDNLGKNGKIFIRPNSGFKIFGGTILDNWDLRYLTQRIDPEKLIIAATPENIKYEWRLVVVNNKIIGGSQYIENDEIVHGSCPLFVIDYGQEVIENCNYKPERAWCLDICETGDGLYVLEVNAFSTSGLYETPLEEVVRNVSIAAVDDWKDINEI